MLTAEYRKTDEYKSLYAAVVAIEPDLPTVLVEQAIWMHKRDPFLYKKILKMEKEESRKQRKLQGEATLKQRRATSLDKIDDVHVSGEVPSGLDDTVDDVVEKIDDVQGSDAVQVGITDDLEKA